jgi:translocator protein
MAVAVHIERMVDGPLSPNPTAARRPTPLWRASACAAAAALVTAGIGGGLTEIGPWYQALQFPDWKPDDLIFPIAWTTIFTLCAVAGVLQWRAARNSRDRVLVAGLWAINAGLNIGWSWLFFALKRPEWALIQVPFLWMSILAVGFVLWRLSKLASVLLTPYVVWVAIAAALNFEIVRLNGLW